MWWLQGNIPKKQVLDSSLKSEFLGPKSPRIILKHGFLGVQTTKRFFFAKDHCWICSDLVQLINKFKNGFFFKIGRLEFQAVVSTIIVIGSFSLWVLCWNLRPSSLTSPRRARSNSTGPVGKTQGSYNDGRGRWMVDVEWLVLVDGICVDVDWIYLIHMMFHSHQGKSSNLGLKPPTRSGFVFLVFFFSTDCTICKSPSNWSPFWVFEYVWSTCSTDLGWLMLVMMKLIS